MHFSSRLFSLGTLALAGTAPVHAALINASPYNYTNEPASFNTRIQGSRISGSYVLDSFSDYENLPPANSWSGSGQAGYSTSEGASAQLHAAGAGAASFANDIYTLDARVETYGVWNHESQVTQSAGVSVSMLTGTFIGNETIRISGIFDSVLPSELVETFPDGQYPIKDETLGETVFKLYLYQCGYSCADTGLIDPLPLGKTFDQTLTLGPGKYRLEASITSSLSGRGFGADDPNVVGLYAWGGGTMSVTVEDVAPLPLPAAVWLFGSGLLGLTGLGRRKAQ